MSDDTLRRIMIADFALNTAPTDQLSGASPGAAPPCPHCGGAGYYTKHIRRGNPHLYVRRSIVCGLPMGKRCRILSLREHLSEYLYAPREHALFHLRTAACPQKC